jgi:transposase
MPRVGRPTQEDRRVLDGIFYILRTGAPWRDLPERYGPYTSGVASSETLALPPTEYIPSLPARLPSRYARRWSKARLDCSRSPGGLAFWRAWQLGRV